MIYDKLILNGIHQFGKVNMASLLYVKHGLKKNARFSIEKSQIKLVLEIATHLGLKCVVGYNDILKKKSELGYSEWCEYVPRHVDTNACVFIYVGRNQRTLEELRYYDEENNDCKVGLLLGYPICCIKHYKKFILKNTDHYFNRRLSEISYSYLSNYFSFCLDATFFDHIPCSLDCSSTMCIAKENEVILKHEYDTIWNYFSNLTQTSVLYTKNHGIYFYKEAFFRKQLDSRCPRIVKGLSDSRLADFLRTPDKLFFDEGGIFINDNLYLKDEYQIVNFT